MMVLVLVLQLLSMEGSLAWSGWQAVSAWLPGKWLGGLQDTQIELRGKNMQLVLVPISTGQLSVEPFQQPLIGASYTSQSAFDEPRSKCPNGWLLRQLAAGGSSWPFIARRGLGAGRQAGLMRKSRQASWGKGAREQGGLFRSGTYCRLWVARISMQCLQDGIWMSGVAKAPCK